MNHYDNVAKLISQNHDANTISILTDVPEAEIQLIAQNMALENSMQALGAERYKVRQEALKAQGKVLETDATMVKIKTMLKPMAKAIAEFRDNYKSRKPHIAVEVFKRHDEHRLALMTMRLCVMAETTKKNELASLCFRLTQAIDPGLDTMQSCRVGSKLISLMCKQSDACFEVVKHYDAGKTIHKVQPTERFYEWEDKLEGELAEIATILRPMVVPPRPWTALHHGGYYDPKMQAPFIRNAPRLTDRTHGPTVIPEVYRAVNLIQATPFKVNTFVLDTANELIFDDELFFDDWLLEIPERPHDIRTKDLRKTMEACNELLGITSEARKEHGKEFGAWVRKMLSEINEGDSLWSTKKTLEDARFKMVQFINWRKARDSIKSKNRVVRTALETANDYRSFDNIYFPANLDWRMRVYPMCSGLTTQGNCIQKALIKFAEGKTLSSSSDPEKALQWLKVHTANSFGMDKASWNDRIAWTDANRELIERIAQDPVDSVEEWKGTDEPWLFIAACEQMSKVYENGMDAVIDIPIPMDGTCSGAQHYAAMTHDAPGAAGVNVIPSGTYKLEERLAELRQQLNKE